MGRLSDEWKYDELKPRPAKDREKAAKKIASLPYEEAVKEMEKLHSEFNINDHNDISRRVMEKTKGNPDNYGKKLDYEVVNDKSIDAIKDNFTPPGAKSQKDEDKSDLLKAAEKVIKTSKPVEVNEYLTLEPREPKVEDVDTSAIDEKDSGKSEEDDLDLYMKDLDDYMSKNKKGRDDIPVTTRR